MGDDAADLADGKILSSEPGESLKTLDSVTAEQVKNMMDETR